MNPDLLKLLHLLVESMPLELDGEYNNDTSAQREARELLRKLEKEVESE